MNVYFELEGFTGDQVRAAKKAVHELFVGMFPDATGCVVGNAKTSPDGRDLSSGALKFKTSKSACAGVDDEITDWFKSLGAKKSTTGYVIDPLESAIESTTRIMREEGAHMADIARTLSDRPTTSLYRAMGEHLDKLLALQLKQLKQLSEPTVSDRDAILVSHLNEMTSKLQTLVNVTKVTSAV